MKSAAQVLTVMGASFLLIDIVYLLWSLQAENFELIGLMTMGLSAILCLLTAFYFGLVLRGLDGAALPEDRLDANVDDGDPEIGHFSPWSWWPMFLAFGLALMFLGLAVGVWIAFIGGPIVLIGIIGWQYEYYRNFFAR